jgi:hypothetical protein
MEQIMDYKTLGGLKIHLQTADAPAKSPLKKECLTAYVDFF